MFYRAGPPGAAVTPPPSGSGPVTIPPPTGPIGIPTPPAIGDFLPHNTAALPDTVTRSSNHSSDTGMVDTPGQRRIHELGTYYTLVTDSVSYDAQYYSLSYEERPSSMPVRKNRVLPEAEE